MIRMFLLQMMALTIAVSASAFAQTAAPPPLAVRQIRLIFPFPPGGATDIVARPFAPVLAEDLQTAVIDDNRSRAAGSVGPTAVANSPADVRTRTGILTWGLAMRNSGATVE